MSKQANQKLKLLYLKDYLERHTDEQHPTTLKQIIEHLSSLGIPCERKTVYADIEELRSYGVDIVSTKGRQSYYFVGQREFQLTELQFLLDAVTASRFLTSKKTSELREKLLARCSIHEREWLIRRIYDTDSLKSDNEQIYQAMDTILEAAIKGAVVSFKYWKYGERKSRLYRNDGNPYRVAPYLLTYKDDNYYAVGHDMDADKLKTFRVDKLEQVKIVDMPAPPRPDDNILSGFVKSNFSIYDGDMTSVTLSFDTALMGVMVDKFGKDLQVTTKKDGTSSLTAKVKASVWFYSWLVGLGTDVKIVSPDNVREEYIAYLRDIADSYSTYSAEQT